MPPKKTYYRIREVVALLGVPASTLRFWEDTFPQLEPNRTPSGQRRYTPKNIEVCKLIKHLLRDKGYSLEYTKKAMEAYRKSSPRNAFVCRTTDDAARLLQEAAKMAANEHAIARIDAVVYFLKSFNI